MSCPYCCGRRKVRLYALEPMSAMHPTDAVTQTIEPDIRDKEFPCPACSTIPKDAVEVFATQTTNDLVELNHLDKETHKLFEQSQLKQMTRAIGDHLAAEKDFYKLETFNDNVLAETKRITLKVVKNSFDTEELEQDRIDEVLNAIGHAAINHVMKFKDGKVGWKDIYNYELRDFILNMLRDEEFKEVLKYFIKENRIIDYK